MIVPSRYGPIQVDLDSIRQLRHGFDPEKCKAIGCCCSSYEITVNRTEMTRVSGYIEAAAAFQPALLEDGVPINPFDPVEPDTWAIDTAEDDDERCIFAYTGPEGQTWCSIHSAALKMGKAPYRAKPRSCSLWPLALSEDRPPLLTVMEDAWDFPCNSRKTDPAIDPGVAELIEAVFGKAFLARIS